MVDICDQTLSILYVDDEPGLLAIGKIFLEKTGEFTVTTAGGPEEGITLLKEQPFDAIISDYQMPKCDGIAFLKYLRSRKDTTPFIIFTGKGREEVVIEALNEGADFYLQKGGDPKAQFAELANKVVYAAKRRKAETSLRESEERYRNVVETQSEFICRFLPDGTFLFVNDAYCRRFKKSAEELIGTRFKPLIHIDDQDKVTRHFASLTPKNPESIIDQRTILPDNKIVWDRWSTRAFFDDYGKVREYQSVGRDITELMERDILLKKKNEELAASDEEIRAHLEENIAAQRQLLLSEERYRAIFENTEAATIIIEEDTSISLANSAFAQLYGYSQDELIGMSWTEFVSQQDLVRMNAYHRQRREGKADPPEQYEFTFINRYGESRPIHLTVGMIPGTRQSVASFHDLTDVKKAELALLQKNEELAGAEEELRTQLEEIISMRDMLEETNEYLGNLITYANAPIIVWDRNLGITKFNDAFGNLTGIPPKEAIGSDLEMLFPDERREESMDLIRRAMAGEMWDVVEIPIRHRSGEVRTLLWNSANIRGSDGETIVATIAQGQDITERKEAEMALRESERKLQSLISNMPGIAYRCKNDLNWTMEYLSDGCLELTGYDVWDIIDNRKISYNDVIHPDYRDYLHEQWSHTLANHGILVLEYPIITKGGQIKWVWEKGSGVYSESGEVVALEGFITDITERRNAEQIIRESESRLRYLLGFYERAHLPEKELLAYALEGACVITGSQLGYLAFLNDDESELSMYAWSETAMKECSMQEKPIVYAVEKTGLWGEAVRQRCPVITNDYAAAVTEKKGYPEGHPQLIRHMNVPILDGDQIVIVAGVANNPLDYTDNDTRQLTLLMQGLWQVLKRRRIEEEFQSQQEQLTEITEMIPGVVFQFYSQSDGEKGLYYISSRADEVFGISSSPEGFLSRFTEQVDPRDRDSFLESIEDATKAGLPWNYEGRFIKPSGEEIWFQGMSRPIQRGDELLFNGILLDITDRKDAENTLNERIKELSCLYRISDAIEGSGRPYAEVMQAIAEIIPGGFQHPEITAASIRIDEEEYSTSDYQLKPWSKQTEIFVHKEPVGSITICLMEDNQILDEEEILISTIADQIGQYIERIRTVARLHQANEQLTASEEEIRNRLDEIVTAQKQLALSEERYQAIFEHTNAASLIIEKDTVISLCNSAFEKLCGYSKDEVIGRSWTEFVSDTDREQMIAYHRQRRETGEDPPQRYEFTFIDRGDASHSTLVTVGMIPGTSQSVASIYDITDRKEAEVALSQAHKKLRILSSITSHDVANKIMTIRGLLEIALDREDKQYTGICHDEIRKATDAIERQIVFMREYEQIGIQESSWMELAPLISRIDDRQLPVQNTCPEISFYADPMVEKVFQNLYVNTILHAQTATRIVISCEEREGDHAIIWEDDGPGIPDDQKEEIFVRGFGKNTGFGLFLAREILAITRITIQETGTYGKGARFEIIVPEGAWQKGR